MNVAPSGYRDRPGPLAVAHRGGAGLAAENTLEAFRRSYALGVRYLETDVRVTSDGRLAAFHDARLRRVTGRHGRVGEQTLHDLQQLDVLGGGRIVGLDDLLMAFPDACFTVDVKVAAAIDPLARMLSDLGATDRVCAAAARRSWLRALRESAGPALTTALPWRELARLASPRAFGHDGEAAFAHVPLRLGRVPVFRDDLVARAHDAGIRVVVWTVNEPDTMHRLLDNGVDGIITDRPDLLREVLINRDQWHTPDQASDRPPSHPGSGCRLEGQT